MTKSKKPRIPLPAFSWTAADPLAVEHQLVADFSDALLKSGWQFWAGFDLDSTAAGKKIREANPDQAARLVSALVARCSHFDVLSGKVRDLAKDGMERINWHFSPEWEAVWFPREAGHQALRRVMRRKLPLTRTHLIQFTEWFESGEPERIHEAFYPINLFVKAVEGIGSIDAADKELCAALGRVVKLLREIPNRDMPKLAHRLEKVLGASATTADAADEPSSGKRSPDACEPAPVGSTGVLVQFKEFLGILPKQDSAPSERVGLDQFALRPDSPLKAEHQLISALMPELVERPNYYQPDLSKTKAGRTMLKADPASRGRLVLAAIERSAHTFFAGRPTAEAAHRHWQAQHAANGIAPVLLNTQWKLERAGLFDVLLFISALPNQPWMLSGLTQARTTLLKDVAQLAAQAELTAGERHVLHRLRVQAVTTAPFGRPTSETLELSRLLRDEAFLALVPGEAFADQVNADLQRLKPAARDKWVELLEHAATATGARPAAKWTQTAQVHLKAVGTEKLSPALARWFPLVNSARTVRLIGLGSVTNTDYNSMIHEDNALCLRGLLWMSPGMASPELIRSVGALTVSCYRKIPGVGPRAVKVGNAGVFALSQMDDPIALGQLALLKVKVKFGSAQKEIEKAFNLAAERAGLPRDELEEMSVPTYGLTAVGVCEEKMGEFTARLTLTGTNSTELTWITREGKTQKAVSADVKAAHVDDLKELQAAAKDIQKMVPAQRERIDSLFLQEKVWPLAVWRERYLEHPLVGTLARRLLWDFSEGGRTVAGIWYDGRLVDLDLKALEPQNERTSVQLWHPIGKSQEEVLAWRSWLDAQQIQQPFKQAHREIYVLTDAERRTASYSNRFAAHLLKQHQFNALCALRGWKNQLRLMVDAEFPPASRYLQKWGLRAEFWIEGAGTNYGTDTNETGTFLYLSTDQVRFYKLEAAQRTAHAGGGGYGPGYRQAAADPVPMTEIPALVFSEVMRDVDLFVGVASVGNDPGWADGGPQGRYRNYWHEYSFGELSASAKTRKEVLQRLVPKLKIASQCGFDEKFLVVRGTMRTYKIHLGSGNILMEPNDQYLCIVPKQSDAEPVQEGKVLLPFEGDRTLSVILSKAFLLAADAKIKDSTILSQIRKP